MRVALQILPDDEERKPGRVGSLNPPWDADGNASPNRRWVTRPTLRSGGQRNTAAS